MTNATNRSLGFVVEKILGDIISSVCVIAWLLYLRFVYLVLSIVNLCACEQPSSFYNWPESLWLQGNYYSRFRLADLHLGITWVQSSINQKYRYCFILLKYSLGAHWIAHEWLPLHFHLFCLQASRLRREAMYQRDILTLLVDMLGQRRTYKSRLHHRKGA